jgi:colanic acid biosynthesis glycosyl transferase WcaI
VHKMRALIVSPVYPPEPIVSSQTSAQIAEELQRREAEVTVVTAFPNRPAGKLYPGVSQRLYRRQRDASGLKIVRCFATLSPESHMLSRFLENISFGVTSGWAVLTAPRPDVIYSNTWAIFATGIMAMVAKLRHVPLVISVQDIYPESLIAQQRIRFDSWLARWMRWVDRRIAHSCAAVIVISPSFARTYELQRGVPQARLHVVPNWIDANLVAADDEHSGEFRVRLGIPASATVVVYGGNIGVAAGVETVIESFRALLDVPDLYLVIAGEGSSLPACQKLAETMDHPRVIFYTPWPSAETSMALHAADVLVLPTRGSQSLSSVPSKLITYMLAARPVIALALPQSDLAEFIEQADCGWHVMPDAPEVLAAKIWEVVSLPKHERLQRGTAGREFALQNLSRDVCLPKVVNIIESVASVAAPN